MKQTGRKRSLAGILSSGLNVARYAGVVLVCVAMLFVLGGTPVAIVIEPGGGLSVVGPAPAPQLVIPVQLASGVETPGISEAQLEKVRGSLRFSTDRGPFFFASLALVFAWMGLVFWGVGQLSDLLRTVRDGNSFAPLNAVRIRRIGWAVLLGEGLRAGIVLVENRYAMQHFSAGPVVFTAHPEVNVTVVVNGLIFLVLAEVFRAGTRLDEEQSLTV